MPYTKTAWVKGDVIDADKLNNIENGVEIANSNLDRFKQDSAEWAFEKTKLENGYYNGWHAGLDLTGQGTNIPLLNSQLDHLVKTGDMYLNVFTSEVYCCVSVELDNSYWDYSFNMKSIEFRLTGPWNNNNTYTNNYRYVDIVYYGGNSYYCKETHSSVGHNAPPDEETYWGIHTSGSVDVYEDNVTYDIDYTLVNNEDKTYTVPSQNSVKITIPASVGHGFGAGVNFKVSETVPEIIFVNNSSYELKKRIYNSTIEGEYIPERAPCVVSLLFWCDGLYVYCQIVEIT